MTADEAAANEVGHSPDEARAKGKEDGRRPPRLSLCQRLPALSDVRSPELRLYDRGLRTCGGRGYRSDRTGGVCPRHSGERRKGDPEGQLPVQLRPERVGSRRRRRHAAYSATKLMKEGSTRP